MKRNSTVKRSLFLNNITLFLIPYFALLLFLFLYMNQAAREEAAQKYQTRFEKMCSLLNTQLESVPKLASQLNQSVWLKNLFLYENQSIQTNAYNGLAYSSASSNLKGYIATNDLIGGASLYLSRSRTILTNDSIFLDWDTLLPLKPESVSSEDWIEAMTHPHVQQMEQAFGVSVSGKHQNGLLYLQSLPYLGSEPRATIVVFLPEDKLEKTVSRQIEFAENMRLELYLQGECVFQMGEEKEDQLINLDCEGQMNLFSLLGFQDRMLVSEKFSNGMECYLYLPYTAVEAAESAGGISDLIELLMVGAILLAGGISVSNLYARRQYGPLVELLGIAEKMQASFPDFRQTVEREADRNEYKKIEKLLTEGIGVFTSTGEKLEELRNQVRQWSLCDYLCGRETDEEMLEQLRRTFSYPLFGCIAGVQGELCEWCEEEWKAVKAEAMRLLCAGETVWVLNYLQPQARDRVLSQIETEMHFEHVGYADSEKGILSLPQALMSARRAAENACFFEKSLMRYDNRTPLSNCDHLPLQDAIRLLKDGNGKAGFQVIKDFLAVAPEDAECRKGLIRRACGELGELSGQLWANSTLPVTYRECLDYLEQICTTSSELLDAQKNNEKERMKAKILKYVKDNLSNQSLSLTSAAAHFGYTPAYFSSLFKTLTGENFLEYVNLMRIEKAKELLRGEGGSIKDIAEKVGFTSDITFRRLFKKYEKISASNYRMLGDAKHDTEGGE